MTTIRLAVLALATGAVLACSPSATPTAGEWDDQALDKPAWSVAPDRAAAFEGAYPFKYYSGVNTVERLVIRDAEAWAALWARLGTGLIPTPPLPSVDFATEMVLFVSQGTQSNGGYAIDIKAVVQSPGRLEILVQSLSPGNSCITTQALTDPTDALIVPRSDLTVTFLERSRVQQCD
jgi:hypothetical protein